MFAPRFPGEKEENWWVVVGDKRTGRVFATRRLGVAQRGQVELEVEAGDCPLYTVYGLCDSYLGCDQQEEFPGQLPG